MPAVRCLSFHAAYRCRRSGRCCTSSWPIPVEAATLDRLRRAVATGALRAREAGGSGVRVDPFVTPSAAPASTPAVVATHGGCCVFLDPADGGCRIHAALGHDALPLACRQFPRVSVTDPGGVSVTLSHYCPTAARMLATAAPAAAILVEDDAFPPDGEYDGLDASRSLPPLLRPDLLMDWSAWWETEARAVTMLTTPGEPAISRMTRLARAVETLRRWEPGQGPLLPLVHHAFDDAAAAQRDRSKERLNAGRVSDALAAVPADLRSAIPAAVEGQPSSPDDDVTGRFLAAHAFASWTAHLGRGLRTWLRGIETAHALVAAGLSPGDADLVLRHLADPAALAQRLSDAERE
jgi:Fe-S-cluster containining protein